MLYLENVPLCKATNINNLRASFIESSRNIALTLSSPTHYTWSGLAVTFDQISLQYGVFSFCISFFFQSKTQKFLCKEPGARSFPIGLFFPGLMVCLESRVNAPTLHYIKVDSKVTIPCCLTVYGGANMA